MRNGPNLEERALDSSKNVSNGVKAVFGAISGLPTPVKAGIVAAGGLAALVYTGTAEAQTVNPEGASAAPVMIVNLLPQVRQHAFDYEQTSAYRHKHPSDLLTGFGYNELVRVVELSDAYRGIPLDTHIAYLLARGAGEISIPLNATHFHNASSVHFGSSPLYVTELVSGFTGTDLNTALNQVASSYYAGEDAQTKANILSAMQSEASMLGSSASSVIAGSLALHPRLLLAAEEASNGIYTPAAAQAAPAPAPAPVQPAPAPTPSAAAVTPAPAPVQPAVPAVPATIPSPVQPAPAPAPVEPAPAPAPTPVAAQVEAAPAPAPVEPAPAPAPVEPTPVQPAPAPVDPCADPAFSQSLGGIQSGYQAKMADHAPAAEVRSHAEGRYDALNLECPENTSRIAEAMVSLDHAIEAYITAENDRVRPTLFTAGGSWLGGEGISNSASGLLHVGFGNPAQSLRGSIYADGGNLYAGDIGAPSGGLVFNLGGRAYDLRLSFGGLWFANQSHYSLDPVTEDVTEAIEGGTLHRISTTTGNGSSSTDGYQPNWLAAAELAVRIADGWKLRLGLGGGQDITVVRDEQHVSNSTTEEGSSHTDGPPGVDINYTAGADVNSDVVNLTRVDTMLLSALLGVDYHRESSPWTFGGGVWFFGAFPKASIDTAVDTETAVHDTVTDINIEGFPPESETTPGSTTTSHDDFHDDMNGVYDIRVVPMGGFDYLAETMAFRLRMGPVLGGNQDGYHSSDLPVLGNAAAYFNVHGLTMGANALFHSNEFDLEGIFATSGDFQRYVGFMNAISDIRARSLVQDLLAGRYASELTRNLITGGEGFIALPGMRVDSEGNISAYGSLAYMHQFGKGPLGGIVRGDSADGTVGGSIVIPLGARGLGLLVDGHYTDENMWTGNPEWGVGGILSYTPGGNQ